MTLIGVEYAPATSGIGGSVRLTGLRQTEEASVRRSLADAAHWLASQLQSSAERSNDADDQQMFRARSEFWSAVECWLSGLGSWRDLRARRYAPRKLVDPDAPIRLQPKPKTGMGSGTVLAWLAIWFGVVVLTIGLFAVIDPQSWVF